MVSATLWAVIDTLGETKTEWMTRARENASVATTLNKLGVDVAARLIYQGYVVAMCNLYVLFGEGFPLLRSRLDFTQFLELLS